MNARPLLKPGLALLLLLLSTSLAFAFSSGPPNGYTGAPGEGNCTGCHTSFPLDSGDGSFGISAGGASYNPDETYTIVVEIADPQAERWGFELTLIDSEGFSVGSLSEVDGNTQVSSGGGRDYGKQTSVGTFDGQTVSATWMMQWIAPSEGAGTISLYGMGNAANSAGGNSGDYIYSFMSSLEENTETGVDPYASFALLNPNYPNPFNPKTRIPFSLEKDSWVRLSIYDARGRLVTVLENGPMNAGSHERNWAGQDSRGQSQPSGVYLARLTNDRGEDMAPARKMILSK
jgi:hypothetical protein